MTPKIKLSLYLLQGIKGAPRPETPDSQTERDDPCHQCTVDGDPQPWGPGPVHGEVQSLYQTLEYETKTYFGNVRLENDTKSSLYRSPHKNKNVSLVWVLESPNKIDVYVGFTTNETRLYQCPDSQIVRCTFVDDTRLGLDPVRPGRESYVPSLRSFWYPLVGGPTVPPATPRRSPTTYTVLRCRQ